MIQGKKFIPLRKLHEMEETQMRWVSRTFGKNTIKGARYDEERGVFILAVGKDGDIVYFLGKGFNKNEWKQLPRKNIVSKRRKIECRKIHE